MTDHPPRPAPIRRLHRALRTAINLDRGEVRRLFRASCGWSDGGCFCLAAALLYYLDGRYGAPRPVGVYRDPGDDIMDHAALEVTDSEGGVWLIDGDGLSSETAFLYRWRHEEGLGDRLELREVSVEHLIGAAYSDEVVDVAGLAAYLRVALGAPESHTLPPGPARRGPIQSPPPAWDSETELAP